MRGITIQNTGRTGAMLFLLMLISGITTAQQDPGRFGHGSDYSLGLSAGHYSWDPAVSLELTSRSIFRDHFRGRIRGNLQWLEAYKASTEHWITYKSYSIGIVYQTRLFDRARFYVEAGLFSIFPNSGFSAKKFLLGYYEMSGVEIFFANARRYNLSFHIGIGPAIIDARAEKLRGAPRYGHGMQYSNGLRFYF